MDGTWGTGIVPYNPDVQFLTSRESEKQSHSVWQSSEFALTEDLYPQSKAATLQCVIYLYIVELFSWHVDQCLICSFVLTWYITQSIFHMPSAKWKWLKLFLLKPMAQHITLSCIKCELTNILLLCWSRNCGCRASNASRTVVPGIWAFGCSLKTSSLAQSALVLIAKTG